MSNNETTKSERQQWLDGLKVGDVVALKNSAFGTAKSTYTFKKVEKITPSRIFALEGTDLRYDSTGYVKSKTRSYSWTRLEPVTQAVRDANEWVSLHYRLRELVNSEKFNPSLDDLREVVHRLTPDTTTSTPTTPTTQG